MQLKAGVAPLTLHPLTSRRQRHGRAQDLLTLLNSSPVRLYGALALTLFSSLVIGHSSLGAEQPNILPPGHDQRYDTLGCAGHPIVQTPTIDRLAADGRVFAMPSSPPPFAG